MLGGLTASSGTSFSWLKNQICKYEQELEKTTGRNVYDIINEEIALRTGRFQRRHVPPVSGG